MENVFKTVELDFMETQVVSALVKRAMAIVKHVLLQVSSLVPHVILWEPLATYTMENVSFPALPTSFRMK
jgi:hypothetical protein